MKISIILMVIAALIILIAIIAACCNEKHLSTLLITVGLCIFLIIPCVRSLEHQFQISETIQNVQKMIENGSKVYLHGQEVDPDVIILEDYKITIKDDVVILSQE